LFAPAASADAASSAAFFAVTLLPPLGVKFTPCCVQLYSCTVLLFLLPLMLYNTEAIQLRHLLLPAAARAVMLLD
jgi:hypothetical protein